MIRAAMVTPNLSLGGAERWLTDLITYSDPGRIEWTGVAVSGWGGADRGLVERLQPHCPLYCNVPRANRPSHARPFYLDGMTEIVRGDFLEVVKRAAQGADVLVTWGSPDMGRWLSWFTGPRIVVSHTTMRDRPGLTMAGITHLAAVSYAADAYFDQFRGSDLPRKVIYNGVDPVRCLGQPIRELARERIRRQWGIPIDAVVVGYIGRQAKEKNFMAAARAVGQFCSKTGKQYYAVYYGMDGTGNQVDEGLKLWCSNNIPGRYSLNSPVEAVGDVLAGLDVLMLASHREAFSLVLIEAWLAGVAVVATAVGSVPEMEDRFGPLVTRVSEQAEDKELGEAVLEAVASHRAAVAKGNALAVAREHLTVQSMVRNWADYLEHVVSDHREMSDVEI